MTESEEYGSTFVKAYSSLLTKVWGSEEEAAKLAADPTAYARGLGLPVADGAVVEVDSTPHEGLLHKDEVVAAWTATPGIHLLRVPASSPIDLDELSDTEMDAVSAGAEGPGNNNNIVALIF